MKYLSAVLICLSMFLSGCSLFDQYADVDKQIKAQMNDPDSYQRIEVIKSSNITGVIKVKFRGNNSFGGKVINYCYGLPDKNGGYKMFSIVSTPDKEMEKYFK